MAHFPPVDPAQPIPEDLAIVRYMKIATFLMLIRGKVFIPSLKTLQQTDPVEALLPSRVYPGYIGFHEALKQGEGFEWIRSKGQKSGRVIDSFDPDHRLTS
jgi:hypothetical protein